jgi:hypothetical protein
LFMAAFNDLGHTNSSLYAAFATED